MHVHTYRGQQRAPDPLELEMVVLSYLVWVLGIEPGSSAGAGHILITEPCLQLSLSHFKQIKFPQN